MDIDKWLLDLKSFWENKDAQGVLSLFGDDIDYYDSPFYNYDNEEIVNDWNEALAIQDEINFDYEIFSREGDKFSVIFDLSYKDITDDEQKNFRGIFLIKLDQENKCYWFYQSKEEP